MPFLRLSDLSELHTVHMTNPSIFITASSPTIVSVGRYRFVLDIIYLLTVIGLTPGGNSTVQIYTQTVHRTTQLTKEQHN